MNLDVITDILAAANLGVLGTTLFQDHMPDDCTTGMMIRTPLNGIPIDSYLPEYYRSGKLQAIVRSPVYETGKVMSDCVRAALTIKQRTNYNDGTGKLLMRIISMRCLALPIVYPRSPGNLTEWSINFDASYFMPGSSESAW